VYYSSALILRRAFGAAAIAWALALPLATAIASGTASIPHASWPLAVFTLAIYKLGGFVCHQLPERSFQLWTMQMPVCARCAGIYAGGAAAALASALVGRGSKGPAIGRTALLVAMMPTLATSLLELTTGWMPGGWLRALAGAPLGAAAAWLIVRDDA
jgi:uncharacterized membrane protein